MMRTWFSAPARGYVMKRRPPPPEPEALKQEMRSLAQARQANDRAAFGLTVTSGRAMATETRVQALMGDMLKGMDRGRDVVD